jgi:hypothetical protein
MAVPLLNPIARQYIDLKLNADQRLARDGWRSLNWGNKGIDEPQGEIPCA